MNCPKCDAEMEKVSFNEIEVDRCVGCRGIWFDMLEKEKLKTLPHSEMIDSGDPKIGKIFNETQRIDCPRCQTRMIAMVDPEHPQVHFESCTICYGAFFDAGEFKHYKKETLMDWLRHFRKKD